MIIEDQRNFDKIRQAGFLREDHNAFVRRLEQGATLEELLKEFNFIEESAVRRAWNALGPDTDAALEVQAKVAEDAALAALKAADEAAALVKAARDRRAAAAKADADAAEDEARAKAADEATRATVAAEEAAAAKADADAAALAEQDKEHTPHDPLE